MDSLIEVVLAAVFVIATGILGLQLHKDKKRKEAIDKNLEELRKIRMAQKAEARRRTSAYEEEKKELERRLDEVETADMSPKEAAAYLRRKYRTADTPE